MHLKALDSGKSILVEILPDQLWKIKRIAKVRGSIIESRENTDSSRLLLTIRKI